MEKIIAVLVLMLIFALPDLLRRKRRYPTRGKRRISSMDEKQPQPQTQPEESVPRAEPVRKKRQQPVQQESVLQTSPQLPPNDAAAEPYRPLLPETESSPEITIAAAEKILSQQHQPEPWSSLPEEARDIYAGLVWSELLQKPVALRHKS